MAAPLFGGGAATSVRGGATRRGGRGRRRLRSNTRAKETHTAHAPREAGAGEWLALHGPFPRLSSHQRLPAATRFDIDRTHMSAPHHAIRLRSATRPPRRNIVQPAAR